MLALDSETEVFEDPRSSAAENRRRLFMARSSDPYSPLPCGTNTITAPPGVRHVASEASTALGLSTDSNRFTHRALSNCPFHG